MHEAFWVGLGGLVATGAAAMAGAIVAVLQARHKIRQEREASALAEYKAIVDRLTGQAERLEKQIDDQQAVIDELREEHNGCQIEMEGLYGWLVRFRDMAMRLARIAEAAGEGPVHVPDLPERPARSPRADFNARTVTQNTRLLKSVPPTSEDEEG